MAPHPSRATDRRGGCRRTRSRRAGPFAIRHRHRRAWAALTAFADSSALVKLYADEPESDRVRALVGLAVSVLARVEVPAALWRKRRTGSMTTREVLDATADFEADLLGDVDAGPRFVLVGVTAAVLDRAATVVAVHGLRTYDGVQLASALLARESAGVEQFACFDEDLRTAAASEGLGLVP